MTDEADAGQGSRVDRHDREIPRDRIEPVVRDVVDEELREHEQEVTIIVAAVVGGGLTLLFAFSMAGVALLAPDPLLVIAVLLGIGTVLLLAGLARVGTRPR